MELHHFICISQANYAKIDRNNNGDGTIVCVTLDEMWPFGHWQQETPEANTCKLARPCIMKHKLAPGKQHKLQSSKSKTQTRRKLNYKKKRELKSKRSAPHRCNSSSSSSNIGGSSSKITITKWNNRVNGSKGAWLGVGGNGSADKGMASCRTGILSCYYPGILVACCAASKSKVVRR